MMICPTAFYENEIKGKSETEINKVIKQLNSEIRRLKKGLENPDKELDIVCCPSDDVVIKMDREYLQTAYDELERLGKPYHLSKVQKSVSEFNEKLDKLVMIKYCLSGFFMSECDYEILILEDKVMCTFSKHEMQLENYELDKEEFMLGLESLYIGEWKKLYTPEQYNTQILDGYDWTLEFIYSNDSKVIFEGLNVTPYNFQEFLDLFKKP